MMEEGPAARRPTAEEVIARLKDDGDFDTLRLKIISKVKENEELRNSIITEVKQSQILNQDGSENLKPRQLSDAVYQELGKKIMGRISDEVWKVIRGGETKDDIKGTVESVYDRIVNPKPKEEDRCSPLPAKDAPGKEKGGSPMPAPAAETNQQTNKAEHSEEQHDQLPHLPAEEELYDATHMVVVDDDDDMPPGFDIPVSSAGSAIVSPINGAGAGAALPRGLETGGGVAVAVPPGCSTNGGGFGAMPPGFGGAGVAAADDEDDDLDVPPGFG